MLVGSVDTPAPVKKTRCLEFFIISASFSILFSIYITSKKV
nr:MAG TPA: hypothetical protein [Caudoviricetes sp.]